MKILVSACLLGEDCKYNGKNNKDEDLISFLKNHQVFPVCPEVMGGLPTPRFPSEIKDGKVINIKGESVHQEFTRGAELALEIAQAKQVDLAILQPRSPSCGVKQVYDGTFSGQLVAGSGIFASLLKEEGFRAIGPDEISDLV